MTQKERIAHFARCSKVWGSTCGQEVHDHRCRLTVHDLPEFMASREDFFGWCLVKISHARSFEIAFVEKMRWGVALEMEESFDDLVEYQVYAFRMLSMSKSLYTYLW
jgi:hypothetical protein